MNSAITRISFSTWDNTHQAYAFMLADLNAPIAGIVITISKERPTYEVEVVMRKGSREQVDAFLNADEQLPYRPVSQEMKTWSVSEGRPLENFTLIASSNTEYMGHRHQDDAKAQLKQFFEKLQGSELLGDVGVHNQLMMALEELPLTGKRQAQLSK